jgi:hypothetical protein
MALSVWCFRRESSITSPAHDFTQKEYAKMWAFIDRMVTPICIFGIQASGRLWIAFKEEHLDAAMLNLDQAGNREK